jgi:hypothetical protein
VRVAVTTTGGISYEARIRVVSGSWARQKVRHRERRVNDAANVFIRASFGVGGFKVHHLNTKKKPCLSECLREKQD